jgi:hypothetical protein
MKYLMLLYSNRAAYQAMPPEGMQAVMEFFNDLQRETTESGELVDTAGLADASHARTVRSEDGAAVATDGPFAEVKEVMASYAVYDVDGHDRAMELADRVAVATGSTVELWPVMNFGGTEM